MLSAVSLLEGKRKTIHNRSITWNAMSATPSIRVIVPKASTTA